MGFLSLGGGAVLDPKNVEILQTMGQLIYLEASYDLLKKRGSSPALGPFHLLYQKRKPIYESISAQRIQVDLGEEAVLQTLTQIAEQQLVYGL